jgi:hypothetical protein
MSRKLALILACSALLSSFSLDAQALPVLSGPAQTAAPDVTLVRDLCGLGFHRDPYYGCIRNGTVYAPPVVVVPPVVVAPHYAPPVVVTPGVCPYGYYLGPYGRCLPY